MTPLKKVRKGDPLSFPASAFNAFVGAAEFTEATKRSGGGHFTPQFRQAGIVRVKNDSGADRDRFNVLGIDGPIFTPTDNEDTFKNQVALTGVVPDEDYHVGKFVILLEPIPDGKIGLACLDGVCPVKLDVQDEGHEYADVADAEAGRLKSGLRGAAQILWKEFGTGEKWAVIRLGRAPARSGQLFAVTVEKTGGSAGDATTQCSFVYTAKDLAGEEIGTNLTPAKPRPSAGRLIAQAGSTGSGTGFYTVAGDFVLWDAGEVFDVSICP